MSEPLTPTPVLSTKEEFLSRVIRPVRFGDRGADAVHTSFVASGYVARQVSTGISVLPVLGFGHAAEYNILAESEDDAPGQVPVVLLSHPSVPDDEFVSLTETVRAWSAGLSGDSRLAHSRKIRAIKRIDHGVPATELTRGMPAGILLAYRRKGPFVVVIESDAKGRRRILAMKDLD